jgi:hypothetical protein
MAAKVESHKNLDEKLNQLVEEAYAQAPAEVRSQIEKGYEEVINKLAHLRIIGRRSDLGAGQPPPVGTCICTNPPHSFPAYQDDCCSRCGCQWQPQIDPDKPHPP